MAYISPIGAIQSIISSAQSGLNNISSGLASVQSRIAGFCGQGGGLYKLYTEEWFTSSVRSAFQDVASKLLSVCSDIRSANGHVQAVSARLGEINTKLTDFDAWAYTQAIIGANAQALAQNAQARLKNIRDRVGDEWASISGWVENRAGAYRDDAVNKATASLVNYAAQVDNWANSEVRPRLNALEAFKTSVESKLPKRTAAEQAAYFQDLARPAYEKTWEFFVQNSLWNLRNKMEGSLEWDPIAAEAKSRANEVLEATNQNLNTSMARFDAKVAEIIDNLGKVDKRSSDLENQLPLTTDALNRRIDEANQSATDKANAALAAANLNIQGVRDKVTGELDDHDSRIRKIEMEIEKVAPALSRIPSLP